MIPDCWMENQTVRFITVEYHILRTKSIANKILIPLFMHFLCIFYQILGCRKISKNVHYICHFSQATKLETKIT